MPDSVGERKPAPGVAGEAGGNLLWFALGIIVTAVGGTIAGVEWLDKRIAAAVTATIASQPIERSDIASITNLQRDLNELQANLKQISDEMGALKTVARQEKGKQRLITITLASFGSDLNYQRSHDDELLLYLKAECDSEREM